MSSLIKSKKFGAAGVLVGIFAASAALIAACGGTGQAEQLDYPENWPAEFAQQVHEEFDGFFNGVAFTDPLPPTEVTLGTLKDSYGRFMCCFLEGATIGGGSPAVTKFAHVVDEDGNVIDIRAGSSTVFDDITILFLSGGYHFVREDDTTTLIPFDKIVWLDTSIYKDILVGHYKRGDDSPLCEIANTMRGNLEPAWLNDLIEESVPEWRCSGA